MQASDFVQFERELWGREPFDWLVRLAKEMCCGRMPPALSIPTACGKSSCIDAAVFALAIQADSPNRTAPLRIQHVVDRRIVVDDVYAAACKIASALDSSSQGVLGEVARRLRSFGGERPLECCRLRGGVPRQVFPVLSPVQPTVLVSTVDQAGSAALFRSYYGSNRAAPVHAGLSMTDMLYIVDEAQCAEPFLATLLDALRLRAAESTDPRVAVLPVSATLPPSLAGSAFVLNQTEQRQLSARISKPKRVRLDVRRLPRAASPADARQEVAEALAANAIKMSDTDAVIGVIANRVETAKQVHAWLLSRGLPAVLLTGRMRPFDRDRVVEHVRARAGVSCKTESGLLYVVATQCVEVGADLDFDVMITECASLDALIQRFGRVDRIGSGPDMESVVVIVHHAAQDQDPIYGAAEQATSVWLEADTAQSRPPAHDMCSVALQERRAMWPPGPDVLVAGARRPALTEVDLDVLCQTSPVPAQDVDVATYLHGIVDSQPDVYVVWRQDLAEAVRGGGAAAITCLDLCRPTPGELLPVPIGMLSSWMRGRLERVSSSDVEGKCELAISGAAGQRQSVVLWRASKRRNDSVVTDDPSAIRPGEIVVIPAEAGGWDLLGCVDATPGTVDIGDEVRADSNVYTPVLRIHPALMCLDDDSVQALVETAPQSALSRDEARAVLESLAEQADVPERFQWRRDCARSLLTNGFLLVGGSVVRGLPDPKRTAGSGAVTLVDHNKAVGELTHRWGVRLGLASGLVSSLAVAAHLHDIGKTDGRFQYILYAEDPAGRPLLAKGVRSVGFVEGQSIRQASGWPAGKRHELVSASVVDEQLVTRVAASIGVVDHDMELIRYLVATHHGRARPFSEPCVDPAMPPLKFSGSAACLAAGDADVCSRGPSDASLESGIPELFWSLVRRYGPWTLAFCECVLRLADVTASREI